MRDIKFRAWDKTNKVMEYNVNVNQDTAVKNGYQWYSIGNTVCDSKLMQYTGLKDKNGKEIYEGDIVVAWSAGHRAVGEVKQRIDGLWIMYPAYQKGKLWGLCPNPKGETSVEVIGNIYEDEEAKKIAEEEEMRQFKIRVDDDDQTGGTERKQGRARNDYLNDAN